MAGEKKKSTKEWKRETTVRLAKRGGIEVRGGQPNPGQLWH